MQDHSPQSRRRAVILTDQLEGKASQLMQSKNLHSSPWTTASEFVNRSAAPLRGFHPLCWDFRKKFHPDLIAIINKGHARHRE